MGLNRILFFGTPDFAVPSLDRLLRSPYEVVGVVTQPDRPCGRGQRVTQGPVKRLALSRSIPVMQPERLRDEAFMERVRALEADLAVVAAYGKILPESLLGIPARGFLNIHASLLPRYRGAAPVQRAVMAGDRQTGVSIMRIVKELDAGPVFAASAGPIGPDDTADVVEHALALLGAELLVRVVEELAAGRAQATPQDERLSTYAARLTREEGLIDWGRPARMIHNQVRGLHPWPHAFTFLDGSRYIILRTTLTDPAAGSERGAGEVAQPGKILCAEADRLDVATGGGDALRLVLIQPEGRRPMSSRDFLAGHRLRPGQVFRSASPPDASISSP
jgi:methionyl-tRNA formyltransferase